MAPNLFIMPCVLAARRNLSPHPTLRSQAASLNNEMTLTIFMLWWSHLIIWITLHFDVGNTEIVSYCICAFGRGICCKSLYVEASGLNNSRKRQCLVVHIYISIDKIVNSITILLNYFHHLVYIVMVISLTLYVNKWKWKKGTRLYFLSSLCLFILRSI